MKIVNICPNCHKESPPMDIGDKKEYKFCPYCGASYTTEPRGQSRVSGRRSRVIFAPGEERKIVRHAVSQLAGEIGEQAETNEGEE